MDAFINPPAFLEGQRKKQTAEEQKKKRTPPEPVRDVLGFLLEHAPLERWEWEILHQIRAGGALLRAAARRRRS